MVNLRCSGQSMVLVDKPRNDGQPPAGFDEAVGAKRYVVRDVAIEEKCSKRGPSSLSVSDEHRDGKADQPWPPAS